LGNDSLDNLVTLFARCHHAGRRRLWQGCRCLKLPRLEARCEDPG
jgi:hypothetical protein